MEKKFQTPQEEFWATEFGNDYIGRNDSQELLASNLNFFVNGLKHAGKINSCLEFGANIGMNLRALKMLFPKMHQLGVEINPQAAKQLGQFIGEANAFEGSIFDYQIKEQVDLTLIKGVLIHINPDMLGAVYDKLYHASKRFIFLGEYFNPSPMVIPYRGHTDRLWKRDFAGEMLDKFSDLSLVDYGFAYKRDPAYSQDNITWFLLEKRG